MKIHAYDQPLADDDIPVLTELPAVPQAAMPAPRVQARYHALLRELDHSGRRYAAVTARALRPRSLRWKVAVSGLALGVLAATIALRYDSGAYGPPRVDDAALVASWTALPTAATAAQVDAAVQQCSTTGAHVAVAEQRGDVTALLLTSSSTREGCLVGKGRSLSVALWSAANTNDDFGARVVAASPFPAAFEVGRVDPRVTRATVTLTDHTVVTATVDAGWAFVWWPQESAAKTVTEYAADGSVVKAVNAG